MSFLNDAFSIMHPVAWVFSFIGIFFVFSVCYESRKHRIEKGDYDARREEERREKSRNFMNGVNILGP
jgi:hypothetical protein